MRNVSMFGALNSRLSFPNKNKYFSRESQDKPFSARILLLITDSRSYYLMSATVGTKTSLTYTVQYTFLNKYIFSRSRCTLQVCPSHFCYEEWANKRTKRKEYKLYASYFSETLICKMYSNEVRNLSNKGFTSSC